jgi:hypothetical protein
MGTLTFKSEHAEQFLICVHFFFTSFLSWTLHAHTHSHTLPPFKHPYPQAFLEGLDNPVLCTSVHVPDSLSPDTETPDLGSMLEAYAGKSKEQNWFKLSKLVRCYDEYFSCLRQWWFHTSKKEAQTGRLINAGSRFWPPLFLFWFVGLWLACVRSCQPGRSALAYLCHHCLFCWSKLAVAKCLTFICKAVSSCNTCQTFPGRVGLGKSRDTLLFWCRFMEYYIIIRPLIKCWLGLTPLHPAGQDECAA